jgi:hypothetical protein
MLFTEYDMEQTEIAKAHLKEMQNKKEKRIKPVNLTSKMANPL